ncbi:MAG: hypothetical protein Q8Q04_01910 [archaeon]|nr:hypothetical protein [archaeon]
MAKKKPAETKGNTIHIKLDNGEAISGKRDLLSSEMSLLKISQSISNHKNLRLKELSKKILIRKKFIEVKRNFSKIENILPALKLPKILQKESPASETEKEGVEIGSSRLKSGDIEAQLREIQAKLEKLESN